MPGRHYPRSLVLLVACLATFAINLDTNIVNVALPTLSRELRWDDNDYANVVFFFQLAYAIGYLGVGRLQPPGRIANAS